MQTPEEILSTSAIGRAANSSRRIIIEYLDKGGIVEYEPDKPQKRVIDCIAGGEEQEQSFTCLSFENCDNDNAGQRKNEADGIFSLRDLCAYKLGIDCFDNTDETKQYADEDILIWAISALKNSPIARQILKEATDKNWCVTLEDREGGDYCMNVEQRLLILDNGGMSANALARSEYFLNRLLITMSKALRDTWQEKRYGGFDEDYGPEDVILMERVRAADLDIVSVLIAWELRTGDYEGCWCHLAGSETGDLAMAFSSYLERQPAAALDLRQALLAAFKQWFNETSRIDACDHDTLEYLDEVLSASELVNPFGNKRPGKMNIEMLSSLPGGAAYLQGQGTEILKASTFIAMSNDINSAHLAHIVKDIETITIDSISFRDPDLARKFFPEMFSNDGTQ